jgi:putative drug exporter of the RND superfamily
MAFAYRRAAPAILASSSTVVIGLFCLLVADLNPTKGLGGVGAIGIVSALIAMMTLLPALLVIFGRKLFWPFVPRFGTETHEDSGLWTKVGSIVAHRPRPVWIGTLLALIIFAVGLIDLDTNLPQSAQFRDKPEAIAGQEILSSSFPAGSGQPTSIIANVASADAVQTVVKATAGVATVFSTGVHGQYALFGAALTAQPGTQEAFDTIDKLRANVRAVPGANELVGGADAISLDIDRANSHDRKVIIPLVLIVVMIILSMLLRSLVAPLMLIATVVVSFAASLGVSVFLFNHLFHFEGMDGSVPLLGFVFLVALGIDYNIFLMSRVHEELARLGTRAGMLKGLSVTGGVITSAGLVLAATFAVLAVLPLVTLTEIGFIVAFGVLLDTFIVRSILVPALTLDIGSRIWWPSRLSRDSLDANVHR